MAWSMEQLTQPRIPNTSCLAFCATGIGELGELFLVIWSELAMGQIWQKDVAEGFPFLNERNQKHTHKTNKAIRGKGF